MYASRVCWKVSQKVGAYRRHRGIVHFGELEKTNYIWMGGEAKVGQNVIRKGGCQGWEKRAGRGKHAHREGRVRSDEAEKVTLCVGKEGC